MNALSVEQWGERIGAAWRSSFQSVMLTGELLIQAKDALEHGEWLSLIADQLPFKARTAQRLMAIARDPRLANATHVSLFPNNWGTLYELTKLSDEKFRAGIKDGTINPEAERKDFVQKSKKERRAARERNLAHKIERARVQIVGSRKLYGVVLADPPWRFEPYSRDTGMDRAADNHYPTRSADELRALRPPAAKDCVLFLWATAPMLPDALRLMTSWGFDYRSQMIWRKPKIGTGFWVRNRHEPLLIGVRGDIPAPSPGDQPESVIDAPIGRHSEKPPIFHELIERMFPNLPKLEMFARASRQGWDAWGAEAEDAA